MSSKRAVTADNLTAREIDRRVGQRIAGLITIRNQTAAPAFNPITYEAIAEKLGISRAYFSRIVNGDKPLQRKHLHTLAELLAVNPGLIAHVDELPAERDHLGVAA